MSVQDHASFDDHAEIMFAYDPPSGLRAIIALHRVWQKPSVGGCRLKSYRSEDEALDDVLRLSRGMTCKSVMAGLPYGGAKAVIVSDPSDDRREAQMSAMARITDRFGGRFRTGVDFGLRPDDIAVMQAETPFVFGDGIRPPSEATAEGVLISMRAAVRHRLQRSGLQGSRVMVQGLGKVGMHLATLLKREGADVLVADVDDDRVKTACRELGVTAIAIEDAHAADVDIFCPCALGGVVNDRSVGEMRATMVVGSANNQLEAPRHGKMLQERGILYAPDYVANAGGLIAVSAALENESSAWIGRKLDALSETLANVFDTASKRDIDTGTAADVLARRRIDMHERSVTSRELGVPSPASDQNGRGERITGLNRRRAAAG